MTMSRESAEVFALNALGWIVGQAEDVLPAFLGATGSSESDIRERAADPEFQLCVLDFLMMDDQWIIHHQEIKHTKLELWVRSAFANIGFT